MTDLNKVILVGRITRDVNEKSFGYIGNGNARLNLLLAVNRSVKKEEQWVDEASFFDVVVWGKYAENIKNLCIKGKQIVVSGSLKQDRWEKDGQKFSKVYIVAESVQFVGSSKKAEGESSFTPASEPQTTESVSIDDDSILF